MPPEMMYYLTNLQLNTQQFLNAYNAMQDRVQEAFDRGYDAVIPTLEYPLPGDLDHIDDGELGDFLTAFLAIQTTMEANDRQNFARLLAVLRSWTR